MKKFLFLFVISLAICIVAPKAVWAGWVDAGGSDYYEDEDGTRHSGWLQYEGGWFYLNEDGTRHAAGWIEDKGKSYYIDTGGMMLQDCLTPDGYRVGPDGSHIEAYDSEDTTPVDDPLNGSYLYRYYCETPGSSLFLPADPEDLSKASWKSCGFIPIVYEGTSEPLMVQRLKNGNCRLSQANADGTVSSRDYIWDYGSYFYGTYTDSDGSEKYSRLMIDDKTMQYKTEDETLVYLRK